MKAAVRPGNRDSCIEVQACGSVLGIRKTRDSLVYRKAVLLLIYRGQHIAGVNHLTLDRVDFLYLTIDPGGQWHDVPVDLRIISTFIKHRIKNEPSRHYADYEGDRRDKHFGAASLRFDATCDDRYSS